LKTKLAVCAALLLALLTPAFAHHGGAAYDMSTVTSFNATITDFDFANPHVLIYFDATDKDGNVEHWTCEAANPAVLLREGWKHNTIKAGDKVTIMGHIAKGGQKLMRFEKIVLPDGRALQGQNLPN
jgi:hypothetical protein